MQHADHTENGRLSPKAVTGYWTNGFLHPIPLFSDDETAKLRAEFEQIETGWLDAGLPLPLNTYKRVNAHVVIPLVARVACDPRVLDVVEGILGPDIMVYSGEFFTKEARTDQIVSLHQDLTYWGLGAIDGLVTAWIALSAATRASGCMDFVPGSHKNEILPHNDTFDANNMLSRGQEVVVDVAASDKVPIELRPGEMSLHHGLTIHGSGPNTSDDRRIGLVIRYIRPDMTQKVGAQDHAMLARGQDLHGNFVHVPAPQTPFSNAALELYDKIRSAQAKIMMKGAAGSTDMYK